MANPITSIHIKQPTVEETQQEKLEELQSLFSENEQTLTKVMELIAELDDAGALDAAKAMLLAKDDIAGIAVHQFSREPTLNLIQHLLGASEILSTVDPDVTGKMVKSVKSGIDEAELSLESDHSVGLFSLMKSLSDPDINRAIKFGLNFLKGMGKSLGEE